MVEAEPVDWFKTAALRYMLMNYCTHQAQAAIMKAEIIKIDPAKDLSTKDRQRLALFTKLYSTHTKMIVLYATKLRLSNQSRWSAKTAKVAGEKVVEGRKPWQVAAE